MLVAIPTAIPLEPLTRRLGTRAGSTRGSTCRSSKLGAKSTVSLSMSASSSVASGARPGFGVAVGRRAVAVDGAEVPLPVHQRVAEGEVLHHADEGVVHRGVAVRVVLAQHVADHGGALPVAAVGGEPRLVHGEEDAPVHRLEPVAHVGKGALHDDAHRIVEERLAHLGLDQPRQDLVASGGLLREPVLLGRGVLVGHLRRALKHRKRGCAPHIRGTPIIPRARGGVPPGRGACGCLKVTLRRAFSPVSRPLSGAPPPPGSGKSSRRSELASIGSPNHGAWPNGNPDAETRRN
jgi:hypothetical protein